MPTTTTNYGFIKPNVNDPVDQDLWGGQLNDSLDDIDATIFSEKAAFPVGCVMHFLGGTAPAKWLFLDGAAVSRTTYADLFALLGTTYGVGDGSTTFNLPNAQRRVFVGAGGTGTGTLANTVGSVGGSETHTLTSSEIPSVSVNIPTGGTFGSYSGVALGGSGSVSPISGATTSGGGGSHNNMQPSFVANVIIYAGV